MGNLNSCNIDSCNKIVESELNKFKNMMLKQQYRDNMKEKNIDITKLKEQYEIAYAGMIATKALNDVFKRLEDKNKYAIIPYTNEFGKKRSRNRKRVKKQRRSRKRR